MKMDFLFSYLFPRFLNWIVIGRARSKLHTIKKCWYTNNLCIDSIILDPNHEKALSCARCFVPGIPTDGRMGCFFKWSSRPSLESPAPWFPDLPYKTLILLGSLTGRKSHLQCGWPSTPIYYKRTILLCRIPHSYPTHCPKLPRY